MQVVYRWIIFIFFPWIHYVLCIVDLESLQNPSYWCIFGIGGYPCSAGSSHNLWPPVVYSALQSLNIHGIFPRVIEYVLRTVPTWCYHEAWKEITESKQINKVRVFRWANKVQIGLMFVLCQIYTYYPCRIVPFSWSWITSHEPVFNWIPGWQWNWKCSCCCTNDLYYQKTQLVRRMVSKRM